MSNYLSALSLQYYRGIGQAIQKMTGFKKFNFFIGPNNAGKSAVLNFISRHLPQEFGRLSPNQSQQKIGSLEYNVTASGNPISMAIGITVDHAWTMIINEYPNIVQYLEYSTHLKNVVQIMADEDQMLWKGSRLPYTDGLKLARPETKILQSVSTPDQWQKVWSALTNKVMGGLVEHWIPETLNAIDGALTISLPKVSIIPALRQIGPKGQNFDDFSGAGLIDQLASLQNPEHNRRADRVKFDNINGFLRHVTGRPEAEIEIPYSREHILVHMDGRILPLESLGTGIHEVIMIATFCTLVEDRIVCIEEPEIHLHPILQRKLINYLESKTTNQYFIATHSAAFIDFPGATIFHVKLEQNGTCVRKAELKQDRFAICIDLGHRASDIIQANAVIWVEGPSDRIYVNHWISIVDPNLIEGVHYSIMFYGGRLLSHLSANDEEVTEFIQLRSLNRNLAIIIDSDKTSENDSINETKRRIVDEFRKSGDIAWVTQGREIENYVDHARLQRAVRAIYSEVYSEAARSTAYGHSLHFRRTEPKRRRGGTASRGVIENDVDKVKVSRAVVSDGSNDLDVLDLKERVTEIAAMIRRANS